MISTRIGSLNVRQGGYDSYVATDTNPRQEAIQDAILAMRANALVVSDAYGWDDDDVRRVMFLGYAHSEFTPLNDSRLLGDPAHDMSRIGVAIGTNHETQSSGVIDLGDRQATQTVLDLGSHGLRLVGVYLDDESESNRSNQIKALFAHLEKTDIPTVIAGDFNAQQPHEEITTLEKLRSRFVKIGSGIMGLANHPYAPLLHDLEKRRALRMITASGYQNAAQMDPTPTALYPYAPMFRVDHIYTTPEINTTAYRVLPRTSASDHRAIVADLQIP